MSFTGGEPIAWAWQEQLAPGDIRVPLFHSGRGWLAVEVTWPDGPQFTNEPVVYVERRRDPLARVEPLRFVGSFDGKDDEAVGRYSGLLDGFMCVEVTFRAPVAPVMVRAAVYAQPHRNVASDTQPLSNP